VSVVWAFCIMRQSGLQAVLDPRSRHPEGAYYRFCVRNRMLRHSNAQVRLIDALQRVRI